jgi:hypothetical protein
VNVERRLAIKDALMESRKARRARREAVRRTKMLRQMHERATRLRFEAMRAFNRHLNSIVVGKLP